MSLVKNVWNRVKNLSTVADEKAIEMHRVVLLGRGFPADRIDSIIQYHTELDLPQHGSYRKFLDSYLADPIVTQADWNNA